MTATRQYVLHIPFTAADLADARDAAAICAEGLSILRAGIVAQGARLSEEGSPERASERVFCGTLGPDGEWCADIPGHPWPHRTPGVTGVRWDERESALR